MISVLSNIKFTQRIGQQVKRRRQRSNYFNPAIISSIKIQSNSVSNFPSRLQWANLSLSLCFIFSGKEDNWYKYLVPGSRQSAPGWGFSRTLPAWPSARSRRCRASWRTWRDSCSEVFLAWAATTASVFSRTCTGWYRVALRKSKSADSLHGDGAARSHRWQDSCCTRSVRRCCTRTSPCSGCRSGSPCFVTSFSPFWKKGNPFR